MQSLITADYHTHTVYSHGTGTVQENVLAAIECGLDCIAICDHGPSQLAHGVSTTKIARQGEEILFLRQKYAGRIKILRGIEANITGLDGSIDVDAELAGRLDIVLAGYHRTAIPHKKCDMLRLQIPALFHLKSASVALTQADTRLAQSGQVFMLTHLGEFVPVDIAIVASACAKSGVFVEINNKHPMKRTLLKQALKTDAKFILSSDAHTPSAVGEVSRALDAALDAGVPLERIKNLRQGAI